MIRTQILTNDEIGQATMKEQGCRSSGKTGITVDAGESPVLFLRTKDARHVSAVMVHESDSFATKIRVNLELVIRRLTSMGYEASACEACLVGGNQNSEWKVNKWRDISKSHGLFPKEFDLNGEYYRKIRFDLKNGVLSIFREKLNEDAWNPASATLSFNEGTRIFGGRQIGSVVANATRFFREKLTFKALREIIVPEHLSLLPKEPLKIWCTSCSNGSEVYSYAMYTHRLLVRAGAKCGFVVLGTDINSSMIEEANAGEYDISDNDVKKYRAYFEEYGNIEDGTLVKFGNQIRRFVSFKTFDISNQPRHHKFHFIICANVFQYYKKDAREHFLKNFVNSSRRPGYIFVGPISNRIVEQFGLEKLIRYNVLRVV